MRSKSLAFFAGFDIEQGLVRRNLQGLGYVADFELKVERLALRDKNFDTGSNELLEPALFGGDVPKACREAGKDVKASFGGNRVDGGSGALGCGLYGNSWDRCAGDVRNGPRQ
jgi:hypothetical protein